MMNVEQIVEIFEKYFAYNTDELKNRVRRKVETEFTNGRDYNCLVKGLNVVTNYLDPEKEQDVKLKRTAGKAFLDKPEYCDTTSDEVSYRLRGLFSAISQTRINIYKTIYKTTLRFGDVKPFRNENDEVGIYEDSSRYFRNIYYAVQNSLGFSDEETNQIFESAAATLIGSVNTDKVYAVKNGLRKMIWEDDNTHDLHYFLSEQDIKRGILNCPSLYDANPDNFPRVYNYVSKHISQERIDKEIQRRKEKDGTVIGPLRAKHNILQSIFLDNFSAFRLKVDKMYDKEKYINSIPSVLNLKMNFGFLFDDPTRIMCIDEIQDKQIYSNAKQNLSFLLWNVKKDESILKQYVYDNPYVLGMDKDKFKNLIEEIKRNDEKLGGTVLFDKFLRLGKTLFANKHYIDFDVDKVIDKLKEKDAMERLDVSKEDPDILSKFCEVFYGEQSDEKYQQFMNVIYYRGLREENGYSVVRKKIRETAEKNGGWQAIVKSPAKALNMYYDISGIWSLRHQVENMELLDPISSVAENENNFAKDMQTVLNDMRTVYAQNKAKLNKKYVNVEDLYNFALMYVEAEFVDIKPVSQLVEEELAKPFREALLKEYGESASSQPTIFGGQVERVDVPSSRVDNLRKLNKEISRNRDFKLEDSIIEIDRQK